MSSGHKSHARKLVRRGSRDDRSPPVAALSARLGTPTVCERCGAVYERKTWRAGSRAARTLLSGVRWTTCPACRQVLTGEYFGRVSIRGAEALLHEAELLGRVKNVAARARFTQPERRLVATDRTPETIEVLTTSQKLAHRIAHELVKAYGGSARYRWNPEDGSLDAVWTWDRRRGEGRARQIPEGPSPTRSGRQQRFPERGRLMIQARGVEIDPRWRDLLEDSAAKLVQRHPELLEVRATLRRAKHEGGKRAGVSLLASGPGRDLRTEKRLPTMVASIHAAFASLERAVEGASQQREPLHGTGPRLIGSVKRVFRDGGYGFIRLEQGREVYFNRHALRSLRFAALRPGDPVEVEIERATEGLQASSVSPAHPRRRRA